MRPNSTIICWASCKFTVCGTHCVLGFSYGKSLCKVYILYAHTDIFIYVAITTLTLIYIIIVLYILLVLQLLNSIQAYSIALCLDYSPIDCELYVLIQHICAVGIISITVNIRKSNREKLICKMKPWLYLTHFLKNNSFFRSISTLIEIYSIFALTPTSIHCSLYNK